MHVKSALNYYANSGNVAEQVSIELTFWAYIREVLISNFGWDTVYSEVIRNIVLSFQATLCRT
jgi:hypothetical protein